MNDYKIIYDRMIDCKIIDIIEKSDYLVVKYGKYNSGNFVISEYRREDNALKVLTKAMRRKDKIPVHVTKIQPVSCVYKKITWDDIDRGISSPDHIGEILRNEEGTPIRYKAITIRHRINNYEPLLDNVFINDFVFVDSPEVKDALEYRNAY